MCVEPSKLRIGENQSESFALEKINIKFSKISETLFKFNNESVNQEEGVSRNCFWQGLLSSP